MTQMTDEQIKAALNGQTQEEQKVATTIDVSADGNVQGVTEGFQHTFTTNKDALPTLDVLDEMGLVDGTDYTYDSRSKTLVLAVTQEQLALSSGPVASSRRRTPSRLLRAMSWTTG